MARRLRALAGMVLPLLSLGTLAFTRGLIHEGAEYVIRRDPAAEGCRLTVTDCRLTESTPLSLPSPPEGNLIVDGRTLYYLADERLVSVDLSNRSTTSIPLLSYQRLDDFFELQGQKLILGSCGEGYVLTLRSGEGPPREVRLSERGLYKGGTRQTDYVLFHFAGAEGVGVCTYLFDPKAGSLSPWNEEVVRLRCGVDVTRGAILVGPSRPQIRIGLDSPITGYWADEHGFVVETMMRAYLFTQGEDPIMIRANDIRGVPSSTEVAFGSCGILVWLEEENRWVERQTLKPNSAGWW